MLKQSVNICSSHSDEYLIVSLRDAKANSMFTIIRKHPPMGLDATSLRVEKSKGENQPQHTTQTELPSAIASTFRWKSQQVQTLYTASLSWKSEHPKFELMTSSGDGVFSIQIHL